MNGTHAPAPERSPDLEWLLQSGQASQRTIATYLVREHYLPLLRLGYALLEDPYAARQLAQETLAVALQQNQRYTGEVSVLGWLDAIAMRLVRLASRAAPLTSHATRGAPDPGWDAWVSLDPALRPAFALRALHNLPDGEIAAALKPGQPEIDEAEVARRIRTAQENLVQAVAGKKTAGLALMEPRLAAAGLGRENPREVVEQILPLSDRERERRKQANLARQGFLGVLGLALLLGMVGAANRWLPLTPTPSPIVQTVLVNQLVEVTSTPGPTPTPYPPLTAESSVDEVLWKANACAASWQTLWADALVIDYGPVGYIGPPRLYRNQVWYRQPDDALLLGGSLEEGPNYLHVAHAWQAFDFDPRAEGGAVTGGSQNSAFQFNLQTDSLAPPRISWYLEAPEGFYIDALIRPNLVWSQGSEARVEGVERVAGRETLRLVWRAEDAQNETRLWIDTQTGLALRALYLDLDESGSPVAKLELLITDLRLNFDLPEDFFEPHSDGYAGLGWGGLWQPAEARDPALPAGEEPPPGRQPLPHAPAPQGFDPSGLALTFQWSRDPTDPTRPGSRAELIAGAYLLGEFELGDPWRLACRRSPDGKTLLYSNGAKSYWISLIKPGQVHELFTVSGSPQEIEAVTWNRTAFYALFSPDSRSLAFTGCPMNAPCDLQLLDLTTGQLRNLGTDFGEAIGVILTDWSADGRYLRMQKYLEGDMNRQWPELVVEVSSGRVIYEGNAINIAKETVSIEWSEKVPERVFGVAGCSRPGETG